MLLSPLPVGESFILVEVLPFVIYPFYTTYTRIRGLAGHISFADICEMVLLYDLLALIKRILFAIARRSRKEGRIVICYGKSQKACELTIIRRELPG